MSTLQIWNDNQNRKKKKHNHCKDRKPIQTLCLTTDDDQVAASSIVGNVNLNVFKETTQALAFKEKQRTEP